MPSCRPYDPAFAYETATIVRHGIQTMYGDGDENFYYLTVYNEDVIQPAKPAESGIDGVSVDEAIVRGLYRVTSAPAGRTPEVRLLASGPAVRSAQEAARHLSEEQGIQAEVWSVTSWKSLRDEALEIERWNRIHPADPARSSHLEQALGVQPLPVVAVSDYVSALPDAIARFVPASGFVSLGTDDFGLSDSREELRSHFGTDAEGIRGAVVGLLDAGRRRQQGPQPLHRVA